MSQFYTRNTVALNAQNKPVLVRFFSLIKPVLSTMMAGSMIFMLSPLASAYDYSAYASASTVNNVQPKIRWYRYYNSNGQPNLSGTITEQHLRYGYEALDRNMQVIKRVPPYSAENYAAQKAKREAQEAQRQSDLNLRKTYGSVSQATTKRDQILADMSSRKSYMQAQLITLQRALGTDIAQAANYERQGKPIPAALQKSLENNRKNVQDAEKNIQAISERQQQVRQQYAEIIQRLSRL
ncbi:hypothetical protein ACF3NA_03725 [Alkanindiges sp. WGS2144]|uniref:hypothetical protein n=1 Tax=Alkanindiges sp. WGS2144 TaxID=3366808 RepID=UPI003751D3C0